MSAIQNDRAQRPADVGSEASRVSPEVRAEIEAVLTTFRQWLLECVHLHANLGAAPPEEGEHLVDTSMRGLLSEWLALREDVRRDAGGMPVRHGSPLGGP